MNFKTRNEANFYKTFQQPSTDLGHPNNGFHGTNGNGFPIPPAPPAPNDWRSKKGITLSKQAVLEQSEA